MIITGGIDLSIGSVVGCAAVLFGILMEAGVHPYLAVLIVVAFGALIGLGTVYLLRRLKLQPFLVTLCGMFIYRGVARILGSFGTGGGTVSRTRSVQANPDFLEPLSNAALFLAGKDSTGELLFPAQFVLSLLLAAVIGFFLHRTAYGRYWYAIGHNELAAKYAGVNVDRQRVVGYIVCSTLAALAGVLLFLDTPSVQSDSGGFSLELYAILGPFLAVVVCAVVKGPRLELSSVRWCCRS